MAFKIIGTVVYGLLALLMGIGLAYQLYKGENYVQSALWLLVFTFGIAAIWA